MRVWARLTSNRRRALHLGVAGALLLGVAIVGGTGIADAATRRHRHAKPRASASVSPTVPVEAPASGVATPSGGATPSATSTATNPAAPAKAILDEQWAGASTAGFDVWQRVGSTVAPGSADAGAVDGKAARLTLPANPQPRPSGAAEVTTKASYQYGTFQARVKTADCSAQPRSGVVNGIFTYANDGRDHDGDGITDNSEIDVEILCAQPELVWLTIWTDYVDGGPHRRVSRIVNVRTGAITGTCFHESFSSGCKPLSGAEAQPATIPAHPSFNSATAYYEYGFTWTATGVRYWVVIDGAQVTLWDYRGPADRIPRQASKFMHNVWHTTNWPVPNDSGAVQRPTAPVTLCVDWSRVSA